MHPCTCIMFKNLLQPAPAAFTMENLDGDWYVPGNLMGGATVTDPFWKQVKAGYGVLLIHSERPTVLIHTY